MRADSGIPRDMKVTWTSSGLRLLHIFPLCYMLENDDGCWTTTKVPCEVS